MLSTTVSLHILWDYREISTTTLWRQHENEYAHNLISSLTKCQTFTFIHEWQWHATITTHWLHQLLTVSVDKYTRIHPKFQVKHPLYKTWVLTFCHISGRNRNTQSWCWIVLKSHLFYIKIAPDETHLIFSSEHHNFLWNPKSLRKLEKVMLQ
jgi:hypothetical protein